MSHEEWRGRLSWQSSLENVLLGLGGNLPMGLHMERGVLQASGLLEAWLREAVNRKTKRGKWSLFCTPAWLSA